MGTIDSSKLSYLLSVANLISTQQAYIRSQQIAVTFTQLYMNCAAGSSSAQQPIYMAGVASLRASHMAWVQSFNPSDVALSSLHCYISDTTNMSVTQQAYLLAASMERVSLQAFLNATSSQTKSIGAYIRA